MVGVEGIVLVNGRGGEVGDLGYGGDVDRMFVGVVKFGIRVGLVSEVEEEDCISEVDVKIVVR